MLNLLERILKCIALFPFNLINYPLSFDLIKYSINFPNILIYNMCVLSLQIKKADHA